MHFLQQEEYKKRQRKQQLDYSVDELKEDIVANDVKSGLKRNEKDLNSKLFGSVNNHRFSLLTSIFIFLLIGIMTFTSYFSFFFSKFLSRNL